MLCSCSLIYFDFQPKDKCCNVVKMAVTLLTHCLLLLKIRIVFAWYLYFKITSCLYQLLLHGRIEESIVFSSTPYLKTQHNETGPSEAYPPLSAAVVMGRYIVRCTGWCLENSNTILCTHSQSLLCYPTNLLPLLHY